MNRIDVIKAGLMVSVQAKPRSGYLADGVSPRARWTRRPS